MPAMTDPADALKSLQQVLAPDHLPAQRGALDPKLFVHVDEPNGMQRFSYFRRQGRTITALAIFAVVDAIDKELYFQTGYAVPEAYRNQGRATNIIEAAIAEMKHGFSRSPLSAIHIEAVVGTDNVASQRVASKTISAEPTAVTDAFSGLPALHYTRKVFLR